MAGPSAIAIKRAKYLAKVEEIGVEEKGFKAKGIEAEGIEGKGNVEKDSEALAMRNVASGCAMRGCREACIIPYISTLHLGSHASG